MDYYFNELSASEFTEEKDEILGWIKDFVKSCIQAKTIGFTTLRTSIYYSLIDVTPDYKLGDWMKDRSISDRDLQRRFKSIDTKTPIITKEENQFVPFEESEFSFANKRVFGLALAYLNSSFTISFKSLLVWNHKTLPITHEFIIEDKLLSVKVKCRNINTLNHIDQDLRNFAMERLKSLPIPNDWNPYDKYLPNDGISNNLSQIDKFYQELQNKSRGEKNALIRLKGREVAELNHYKFDKDISDKNKSNQRLRDIYESQNIYGRTLYLSIDFEKGAFEVCDEKGQHLKEILFNGKINDNKAESSHNIII